MGAERGAQMNLRLDAACTARRWRWTRTTRPAAIGWRSSSISSATQPAVSAVRIDPAAHKVSVATIGNVDAAQTSRRSSPRRSRRWRRSSPQARRCARRRDTALRQEGGATVVGREHLRDGGEDCGCGARWNGRRSRREPDARGSGVADARDARGDLRRRGNRGLRGGAFRAGPAVAGEGVVPRRASIAGGWDAAVDTWGNLKKREIDIHFLMLAVAIGAMFIGAWGEAVLLLFLFSASGAMEEYRARSHTARSERAAEIVAQKRDRGPARTAANKQIAVETSAGRVSGCA